MSQLHCSVSFRDMPIYLKLSVSNFNHIYFLVSKFKPYL
jgi:hypothetical protein